MKVCRVVLATAWLALVWFAAPALTSACSAVADPSIKALGPEQVVVIGTIGEPVPGGRLFHVERWFNGGVPMTPIVIAFQEGEPVGDCSYLVSAGTRLIIAPEMQAGIGRLSANVRTIQGDPDAPDGKRWVDEAVALFGPGVVPPPVDTPAPEPPPDPVSELWPIPMVAISIGVAVLVLLRQHRRSATTKRH